MSFRLNFYLKFLLTTSHLGWDSLHTEKTAVSILAPELLNLDMAERFMRRQNIGLIILQIRKSGLTR